jgi:hypothetical protein
MSDFDWNSYDKADDGFNWDEFEAERPKVSSGEAIARGGLQGLTANTSDEVVGGVQGIWEDAKALFNGTDANNGVKPQYDEFGRVTNGQELTGNYKKYRDEERALNKQAEADHPMLYKGSEIGGGVVSGLLAPGASTLSGAIGYGSLQGLGGSDSDDAGQLIKDTAIGGAFGAAGYGAGEALKQVPKAANWVMKKGGRVLADVPEQVTDAYLKNPAAIRGAENLDDVTKRFLDKSDEVRGIASGESGDSFKLLSKMDINAEDATSPIRDALEDFSSKGIIGQDRKRSFGKLKSIAEDVIAEANESGVISLDKAKQAISVIDNERGQLVKLGADPQTIKAFDDARKGIDMILKGRSPEYKSMMASLAEDTQAMRGIQDKFRTPGGAQNLLKRIQRGKDQFSAEALDNFDSQFGTTFKDDLTNSFAKDAFEKTGANGSRRTLLGSLAGSAVGSMVSPGLGTAVGGAIGAGIGSAADKYAGIAYRGLLDGSIKFGPTATRMLTAAAEKGPQVFMALHRMLLEKDPTYRKALEDSQP